MTVTPPAPKKSRMRLPLIGCGIIVVLCLGFGVFAYVLDASTPASVKAERTATAKVQADETAVARSASSTATAASRAANPPPSAAATTAPPPAGQVGKVGTPMSSGGIELLVAAVDMTAKEGILTPKAGNSVLSIQVSVKNTNRDKAPYNPLYFKVKDDAGFEYTTALLGREPTLKSGELTTNDNAAGWVSFEVPTTAKGFTVSYQPLVIFGGYQTIRINLGR